MPEEFEPTIDAAFRARLHRLNDMAHAHELLINANAIRLTSLERQVTNLANQGATREQLDNAVLLLGQKMTASMDNMSNQIKSIADDLSPLKRGIYWVVGLVLSAFIMAILAMILRQPILR